MRAASAEMAPWAIYTGVAEVRVFEGAAHRMAVGESGLAPGYLDALAGWVRGGRGVTKP